MITVFTPAYNRAYILPKLYDSLKAQTSKAFEWIVVDDGSKDDTASLFDDWCDNEKSFDIRYSRTENGGKHRAINQGVKLAKYEAFFIVDSDDSLLPDAIEKADEWFGSVKDDETIAGVAGLRGYDPDQPIGGFGIFDGEYVECTNYERGKYNLWNDKAEIYKTEILRKYPFPEFDNENFLTESIVWDRIAYDGYRLRWYNEIIYLCDYLEDGLTRNIENKFVENPKGTFLYLSELEKSHPKEEVDVLRLKYYNNLIKRYGMDRALKIIGENGI